MKLLPGTIKLLLVVGSFALATNAIAQTKPLSPSKASPSLSDQEKTGQNLFVQRCSVCHMPQRSKAKWDAAPSFGPSLSGLLKNAKPSKEEAIRQSILKGSDNMPGFQYGLEPQDINAVIAYLKTL